MKRTLTEDQKKKMREGRSADKLTKIGEFYGYEIFADRLCFTTIKDGIKHFYSTLTSMFWNINLETNEHGLRNITLKTLGEEMRKAENKFVEDIKAALGPTAELDSHDYLKMKW